MIKDALTHAANFANEADKTSAGHSFVVISDRTFAVSNGTSGAIVCGAPDGITATVALKQLRKTIAKSGDSPALSVGKGKLMVKAGLQYRVLRSIHVLGGCGLEDHLRRLRLVHRPRASIPCLTKEARTECQISSAAPVSK